MPVAPTRGSFPGARRQQLLDAAAWVFARKGYRAAAISDIIARAHVARGTFYLYFASKEQIFLAIVEEFHDPGQADARRARGPRPARRPPWPGDASAQFSPLAGALRGAPRRGGRDPQGGSVDRPRFQAGAARLRELALNHFAERFRRVQAGRLVNPSVSPELVAHLQLGMVEEVVNAFVLPDSSADLDALAAKLAAFEWNGIPSLVPNPWPLVPGPRPWEILTVHEHRHHRFDRVRLPDVVSRASSPSTSCPST